MFLRSYIRRAYLRTLQNRARELDAAELRRTAVVFAPHQDDETLACGGTIIKKRQAGAEVTVVFLTDGRSSHQQLMPAPMLIEKRKCEAIAACGKLGVAQENVQFLNFEDGRLTENINQAIKPVIQILKNIAPEEVYIPHYCEAPPDHTAANQIVLTALAQMDVALTVNEYPVWLWNHWPWVGLAQNTNSEKRAILKNTYTTRFGTKLLQDFRAVVPISDVLDNKKEALEQHQTQMARVLTNAHWPILQDVSNGEWLDSFFQKQEIFHRYQYPNNQ